MYKMKEKIRPFPSTFGFLAVLAVSLLMAHSRALAQDEWVSQSSGTNASLNRVQFLNADLGYVAGDDGTVLKTTNGGELWTSVSPQTNYPVRDLCFVNDMLGWVATGDPNASSNSGAVWQTTDGGDSWTQQNLGTTEARFGISFVSEQVGWACGANNGPWDIRATTNGGESWAMQSGSGYGWTYDICCVSSTLGWSVGIAYYPNPAGFIVRTSNGGANWNQVNTGLVPFLYGVQFLDSLRGYAVGDSGAILATTNGGTNWTTLGSSTQTNLADLFFLSPDLGWVCGAGGLVLKTTDGGQTWDSLDAGATGNLNGVFFTDSTTGWVVGSGGTILKGSSAPSAAPREANRPPQSFVLYQNSPNPFNPTTEIGFDLVQSVQVVLDVYDLQGRRVSRLLNETLPAGSHNVTFDASQLPTGVYIYHLWAGRDAQTRKMILLK